MRHPVELLALSAANESWLAIIRPEVQASHLTVMHVTLAYYLTYYLLFLPQLLTFRLPTPNYIINAHIN